MEMARLQQQTPLTGTAVEIKRNHARDFEIRNEFLVLRAKDGFFSVCSQGDSSIGWRKFYFETVYNKTAKTQSITRAMKKSARDFKDAAGKGTHIIFSYDNIEMEDELHFKLYENERFITIRHDVRNASAGAMRIFRTADVVTAGGGGVSAGPEGFLIHSENISRYNLFDDYEDSHEFVKAIPFSPCTFGDNENFPFPALFIGSKKSSAGLVDAVLSQERRVRVIRLAGEADGIKTYRGEFHQRGIEAITLEPKETLEGEVLYLEIIDKVDDYNLIFEKYLECLTKRYKFRGPKSPCVKEVIWGSWNEGIYENVTEEVVLRNARFLKKSFPTVKWVQIDAGYCFGEQGHGSGNA